LTRVPLRYDGPMMTARLGPVKLRRWAPRRLPMRGAALLVGRVCWEVELDPATGELVTAYAGVRTGRGSYYLELVPRVRVMRCG
jgi:hypothetical protein